MKTEYKGFTIIGYEYTNPTSERHYVTDGTHKTVAGFNESGYASVNAAKGAITKHINAQASERAVFEQGVKSQPATSDDKDRAVANLPIEMNTANLVAALRFHGFIKGHGETVRKADSRSRTEREGPYAGKFDGKNRRDRWKGDRTVTSATSEYYAPNRRILKMLRIEVKNARRGVQYGGNVKFGK